jgi:cytochrome c553
MNNMKTIFLCLVFLMLLVGGVSYAGTYLDSAHGNSTYGVDRTSTTQYATGHCAYCHEQHASIGGDEPSPDSPAGPDDYLLFSDNHTSQTVNFCFDCHRGPTGGYQTGGLVNRSYSYRAGGWTSDTLDDILQAFTYGPPASTTSSSHKLDDIKTFITGKWGYTANSNPCIACHNPHAVQGDPANSASSAKSSGTRGYPVSLPSDHADKYVWDAYGDDAGEKMSNYVYQAPYRSGSTSIYEPDGSTTTTDGTNLTDYVTLCTDCHHYSPTPVSTRLGNTNLRDIDWAASVHGGKASWSKTDADERKLPYKAEEKNYVLACTDCHEPHGSPNYCYLIRKEVNGDTTTVTADTNTDWDTLCTRCHTNTHESNSCIECHYHGAINDSDSNKPLF